MNAQINYKKISQFIIVCMLTFAMVFINLTRIHAAEYEVTFKAGAYGTINETDKVTYKLQAGDTFPNEPVVKAKDGYVFTGWSKQLPSVNSKVNSKQVYVAKYDVLIEGASYLVRYVDQNRAQISTPKSMTGELGSQIVERAKNISGYKYQEEQLTFTLTKDAQVIEFVYENTQVKENIIYEEEVINVAGPNNPQQGNNNGTANPQNPNQGNNNNNNNEDNANNDNANKDKDNVIDDNEVPLANAKDQNQFGMLAIVGGVSAAALILIAFIVYKKRNKKEN